MSAGLNRRRLEVSMLRALALALVLAAVGAAPAMAEQPRSVRLAAAPPATAQSPIFDDPAWPGTEGAAELAAAGYVSQEFFVSGEASVYGYGPNGALVTERTGVPYTTRIVVLRPKDARRFSGNVQLSPFHPVLGNNQWAAMRGQALGNGDAILGVMVGGDPNTRGLSKPGAPVAAPLVLKWFDPARYAPIAWPDEDGVRWDVLAQVAALARSGAAGPFPDLKVDHVHASGWSFNGSLLRTFINEGFHDRWRRTNGGPLIDGYLIGISAAHFRSGYLPINTRTQPLPEDDPRRTNKAIDVPVIELMSENEAVTNVGAQLPESDAVRGGRRIYEVPGTTHAVGPRRESPATLQLAARNHPYALQKPPACDAPDTDVRLDHFASGALANLDRWVRTGQAPPRAERFDRDPATGQGRPDALGNSRGGVRSAQLEVPLARYGDPPGCAATVGLASPFKLMKRLPLDPATMARLYPGGRREYLQRFDTYIDGLTKARWLRPADAAEQKAEARRAAAVSFP